MRPLLVYLDSSDFSRFGELLGNRGKAGDEKLLQELERFRDDGDVEFRYSFIHVAEAAPTTDEALPFAQERALAMMRLCGRKVLAPYFYLPHIDAAGLNFEDSQQMPRDRNRFHGRSDEGQWFNSFREVFVSTTQCLKELYSDPIKAVLENEPDFVTNRAQRRNLKKNHKSKLMARQFAIELPNLWKGFQDKIRDQFPLSDATSKSWQNHLLGKTTTDEVNRSLAHDLSNLPHLMEWLKPGGNTYLYAMPSWLRNSAQRYKDMIASIWAERNQRGQELVKFVGKNRIQQLWKLSAPERRQSFEQKLRLIVLSSIESDSDYIKEIGATKKILNHILEISWIKGFPSQHAFVEAYFGNFDKNISPFEQLRKIEKVGSDVGDIFHAMYMPYVDLMRVDGFAMQYLGRASDLMKTTLIDKLEKLPEAINVRLKQSKISASIQRPTFTS